MGWDRVRLIQRLSDAVSCRSPLRTSPWSLEVADDIRETLRLPLGIGIPAASTIPERINTVAAAEADPSSHF